jgi:predicted nucleic acid-binding protein
LLDLLERGILRVAFDVADEVGALKTLLQRYADRPMSLADACLVCMSEARDKTMVWTLDTDFRVYRRRGRLVIPTLFPPGV